MSVVVCSVLLLQPMVSGVTDTVIDFDITKMDWTYDATPKTTLKVCRENDIDGGASVDLVVSSPPPVGQKQYPGTPDDTETNCAIFTWDEDFLPSKTERKYELIVDANAGTIERGTVTYSMTYTVFHLGCYETDFVRLSLETWLLTVATCPDSSPSDETSPHSICYVKKEEADKTVTMCADQVGNSPAITVCLTLPIPEPVATSTSTVKALSYANKRLTATETSVSEMLIRRVRLPQLQ
ncbi:uncharacterized protein LOC108674706 [Hyalella azteca]|uniref:Uncharacterized protein LOC108674706 n=1 Tax=Hyalella azteca TaxID=294128 RepID=A0A8B7NWR1_HYAAZ|nr:uncharacterized protein LOC108674706 [Hyalella azteca]